MEGLSNQRENKTFASILSDGKFHVTVPEGTEGAILREYESSEGEKGEKYELLYDTLSGVLEGIYFRDSEYGNQLHICLGGVDLSLNANSNFASDFMKKLPNINVDEHVDIGGYAFADSKTKKTKRGIVVKQGDDKIANFFYDADKDKELHDFPTPEKDNDDMDTDDWKIHFIKVTKFLVAYTTKNHLIDTPEAHKDAEEGKEEAGDMTIDDFDDEEKEEKKSTKKTKK